jgi:hypothetical protein
VLYKVFAEKGEGIENPQYLVEEMNNHIEKKRSSDEKSK